MLGIIAAVVLLLCVMWWGVLGVFLIEKPSAIHNKKFMLRAIIPFYIAIERLWDKK